MHTAEHPTLAANINRLIRLFIYRSLAIMSACRDLRYL
jgi:hypothetical protein